MPHFPVSITKYTYLQTDMFGCGTSVKSNLHQSYQKIFQYLFLCSMSVYLKIVSRK